MSYKIRKTTITLTRGDTFLAKVLIEDQNGNEYIPKENDVIQFAVKRNYNETEYLISKIVPNSTMVLKIDPEDTKGLDYGEYVYDMQITFANGDVNTFITTSKFIVTEEVC